uniref:Uncharacterized protein n=1 Tax=Rhizophora mucronata TaxID=61149 RepID=A0A2P2N1B2_RHIMU
MIHQSRISLT